MNRAIRYVVLIPLSALAFYVLFLARGVDVGLPGSLAVLGAAWVVWYLLWATLQQSAPAAKSDDAIALLSPGEERAWVGLLFTAGILAYLALHSAQMVSADGSMAPEASRIGRQIVMLILFWQIVMQVLKRRWRDAVERDERDRIIDARADRGALIALSVFVIGVAVTFAFSPIDRLAWAKPMTISNLMLYGLIGSSALGYLATGVSYWRDRH